MRGMILSSDRKPPLIPLFSQDTDHSSPPEGSQRHHAQRRSRACPPTAIPGAALYPPRRENRLEISWDLEGRRCDAGSIDAAGWGRGGRAGGIDDAPPNGLANRDIIRSSSIELPAGCGRAPINSPMFLRVFSERSSHFGD